MGHGAHVRSPSRCFTVHPQEVPSRRRWTYKRWFWKQPVPTSSYLIAIVVADLEARDISERCRVWSEPSVVDKALHEFSETEQFLRAAEDITGQDYVWKRMIWCV